jgi:hypothetical protein
MVPATVPGRREPLLVDADSGVHTTPVRRWPRSPPARTAWSRTVRRPTPADRAAGAIVTRVGNGEAGRNCWAPGSPGSGARMPRPRAAALAALAAWARPLATSVTTTAFTIPTSGSRETGGRSSG